MDRKEKAVELFLSGYGCSQAVIGAYCDLFGMDFETAVKVAEGFGGGMGRMRLTCGAVSGMFMLSGLSKSKAQPKDLETRTEVYGTVQQMAEEFKKKNGSIICAELLGVNKPKDNGASPTIRDKEFFKKRPCVKCVEDCAEIVEKYLIDAEQRA